MGKQNTINNRFP